MNSREELFQSIQAVISDDWIETRRHGNVGGVGNTIEDILGIPENNFSLPDAGEYELKCKRRLSTSLITLFHFEPYPRQARFIPRILLPLYGWRHELAGIDYPDSNMTASRYFFQYRQNLIQGCFQIVQLRYSLRNRRENFDAICDAKSGITHSVRLCSQGILPGIFLIDSFSERYSRGLGHTLSEILILS